jgi:selenide,water dikinase
VKQGVATGASERNWKGYGHEVQFAGEDWKRKLLTDPQTSGGLLVACAPQSLERVLGAFDGEARRIGTLREGAPRLLVA